jgi:hypothetical protein
MERELYKQCMLAVGYGMEAHLWLSDSVCQCRSRGNCWNSTSGFTLFSGNGPGTSADHADLWAAMDGLWLTRDIPRRLQ